MKNSRILMITTSYPYGKGEPFVDPEMKFLSKYFKEVEIVPAYYKEGRINRNESLSVNLRYAKSRWGKYRILTMAYGLFVSLNKYNWLDELKYIFEHEHKWSNLLEIFRALYRAQLFDEFLGKKLLKVGSADSTLVYFYCMVPEILGALSFRNRTGSNIKIVSRGHGGDIYEDQHKGNYLGFRRAIASGIDAVFCISNDGNSYLRKRYPSLEYKCHNAKLGVFDPGFLNSQPVNGVLSLVSCAFIKALKRIDLIVDAVNCILLTHPNVEVKWTHIGDGELFDEIREYSLLKLGNRAKVVFTGYLTEYQIMKLYRNESFDVFINVSTTEGLPVSLMEAASVGLPLVATNVGGTREIVNSDNGILIPVESTAEDIASALLQFLDRSWALSLRERSRLMWSEKFDAEKNHNLFCRNLVNILESS
jgi:colanic acid/amylovoran biosynthesis glycosyltransferase